MRAVPTAIRRVTILQTRTGKVWCGEARGSAPGSRNCEVSSTEAAALADRLVLVMKFL